MKEKMTIITIKGHIGLLHEEDRSSSIEVVRTKIMIPSINNFFIALGYYRVV